MFLAAAVTGNLCVKTKIKKMGRSGRVASRVCSTLELRMSLPHAPSSSMALTLPPPPSSSTFALISNPPMCSNSTTAPHPSPDMPRQSPPPPAASVKKKSQPWLQDVFQFMRQHVEVLLLPSSDSSNCSTSTGGKEKRDRRGRNEQEEARSRRTSDDVLRLLNLVQGSRWSFVRNHLCQRIGNSSWI